LGREEVLPVIATIKDDVLRYPIQPLNELVQFDSAELRAPFRPE
jgi:hypothetical protein